MKRPLRLDVPGPTPGQMIRAIGWIRRAPLEFLEAQVSAYGDLVAFPLPTTPVLLVNDPAGARRVLVDNQRGYSKQTVQYRALAMVTGAGLLTADGDAWRRSRRTAQPAFHPSGLRDVADRAYEVGTRLRGRWDAAVTLDVDAAAMQASLDLLGRTLFDDDLAADGARVIAAVDRALRIVVRAAQSPLPARLPTLSRLRLRRAVAVLDDLCAGVVARRRARGIDPADGDLLALLLRAADDGTASPGSVRDDLITLVIAGHETLASCLAWTLHLLSHAPDVQDRLRAELAEVGGRPRWDDLPRLRWTRAVVDESLRLYPPAWVITRRALAPDAIAGVAIPAGTLVIVSPWLLHRRPSGWDEPGRFDPSRFVEQPTRRPDYIPFGAGQRLCIGRDLALVEAVLVLAALLPGRRIEPAGGPPLVDALVTLRPRGGLPLRLTRT